jgi:hypothetical protein
MNAAGLLLPLLVSFWPGREACSERSLGPNSYLLLVLSACIGVPFDKLRTGIGGEEKQ